MSISPHVWSFNVTTGTPKDYIWGLYRVLTETAPSGWVHYWQVDTYSPSADINMADMTVSLIDDSTKKVRLEAVTIAGRDTIRVTTSDGTTINTGTDTWTPHAFIDGYVDVAASLGTSRTFTHATYGAQTSGLGGHVVELPDALCFYVRGKGAQSGNWQFGFQAGNVLDYLGSESSSSGWGLLCGQPTLYAFAGAGTNWAISPWAPLSGSLGIAMSTAQAASRSLGSYINLNGLWMGVGFMGGPAAAASSAASLGDYSGTRYRNLVPAVAQSRARFNSTGTGTGGGLWISRYFRFSSEGSLNEVYSPASPPFSSTIAWIYNLPVSGTVSDIATNAVFIWSKPGAHNVDS